MGTKLQKQLPSAQRQPRILALPPKRWAFAALLLPTHVNTEGSFALVQVRPLRLGAMLPSATSAFSSDQAMYYSPVHPNKNSARSANSPRRSPRRRLDLR